MRFYFNKNSRNYQKKVDRSIVFSAYNRNYYLYKAEEDKLLEKINKPFIRLWRYKNEYFYRPDEYGEPIIGDKKKIALEIASRYGCNILIVDDLNDINLDKSNEIRINTKYLAITSIPLVEREEFNTKEKNEIVKDSRGFYTRNLLRYSPYLIKRFNEFIYKKGGFKDSDLSFAAKFIDKITTLEDSEFCLRFLSNFFIKLENITGMLILMGNKDVSENILIESIIKPIFGADYCITITEEILRNNTVKQIAENKLFVHINYIPNNKEDFEKLKDIVNSSLIAKPVSINNLTLTAYTQILVTLDEPHFIFKDYKNLYNVINIDSIENIKAKIEVENDVSLSKQITASLDNFSDELFKIGNLSFFPEKNHTNNEDFNKLLDDLKEEEMKSRSLENNDNLPILDSFEDTFDTLIPYEEKFRNALITGEIGSGKSSTVCTLIHRDYLKRRGNIILIDPHGDLAKEVLNLVDDKTRLVYIDPLLSNLKTPTFNLFEITNKTEESINQNTQLILTILKNINDDNPFSSAMEYVAKYSISFMIRSGNGSFSELKRLMIDVKNSDLLKAARNSPNLSEAEFFRYEFKDLKKVREALKYRIAKLEKGSFQNLMNGTNTIDLKKLMNAKDNIIIFNVPKGDMPDTYEAYVQFLLCYIQIIALKRASLSIENRLHTNLYIDEFQDFTKSIKTITEMLTQLRKFGLHLTLISQTVSQITKSNYRDIIISNTNIKIIFGNIDKTLLAMNKTLNAKLKDVPKSPIGVAYLSVGNNEILKFRNSDKLLIAKKNISEEKLNEIIEYQLDNYYRDIIEVKNMDFSEEELKHKIDEFIIAIKSKNISYFAKIKEIDSKKYEELIYNFNDGMGYIAREDLGFYFDAICSSNYFRNNNSVLLNIIKKDKFFEQKVDKNKTYNGKKRYILTQE